MFYKNVKLKEKQLINYLKQNPTAGWKEIKRDTKIKVERIYPGEGLKKAYVKAGIPLIKSLKKRTRSQMLSEIIEFIKDNHKATTIDIKKKLGIDIPKTFKTIKDAYKAAGVPYNPKLNVVGTALPEIKLRATKFEEKAIKLLEKKGKIKRKVRTKEGKEADALWYYKNKSYVIEVKNYIKKRVTFSDIKQILNYMENLDCKEGIIIHSYYKNKIDKVNIGEYSVKIIPFHKLQIGNVV